MGLSANTIEALRSTIQQNAQISSTLVEKMEILSPSAEEEEYVVDSPSSAEETGENLLFFSIEYPRNNVCDCNLQQIFESRARNRGKRTWIQFANGTKVDIFEGLFKATPFIKRALRLKPPQTLVRPEDVGRFYLICAYVKGELLHTPFDAWLTCFIEASIKYGNGGCLLPDPVGFCVGKYEGLVKFFRLSPANKQLIFVGDSVRDSKIYAYTESIPTYKRLTQGEFMRTLGLILEQFFSQIPEAFSNTAALDEISRYLASKSIISIAEFNQRVRMGVPFEDYFAELNPQNTQIQKVDYSADVFTEHIVQARYEPPVFNSTNIVLKRETFTFLENLCASSQYKYNVLRGFCRLLLSAKEEGNFFQTCIWVSGPPGTMKSTWPNLLKILVPPSRVQEQSKIITPFTAGQLENCDLLILSDVQSISKDVVGLLKAFLGRDPITLQEKFKQEITFINPNCQVIIVSNFPPTHLLILL